MTLDITTLNGQNGFVTTGTGPDAIDVHGIAVAGLGDVNGDGIDDFIVGSDGGDAFVPPGGFGGDLAGRAHVVFGTAQGFPASIDLSQLDGTDGFTVIGPRFFAQAGFSVGPAGDLNNDGFADIVVGAPRDEIRIYELEVPDEGDGDGDAGEGGEDDTPPETVDVRKHEGGAYIIYGRDDFQSATENGNLRLSDPPSGVFKFDGDELISEEASSIDDPASLFFGEEVGFSVGGIGDVNGDGVDDLLVGSKGDRTTPGDVFVVFGEDGQQLSNISISDLNGQNGFRIGGDIQRPAEQTGTASHLADVNGDGIADIIIGSREADLQGGNSNNGLVTVIFGGQNFAQNGGNFSRTQVNNGLDGFTISGKAGTLLGWSLDSAGDVNGDGIEDLIIGSAGSNGFRSPNDPQFQAPDSYVIFGSDTGFPSNIDLNNLNPSVGVRITKGNNNGNIVDFSNEFVGGLGDVNGDGFDDIGIGVNQRNREPGFATIIYGGEDFGGQSGVIQADSFVNPSTGGFRVTTSDEHPGDIVSGDFRTVLFGSVVSDVGDVNNDGVDDFAIGAPAFTGDNEGNVTDGLSDFTDYERGKTAIVFGVKFEQVDDFTAFGTGTKDPTVDITVTVRLTGPANNLVTVNYETQDGTAVAGSDFQATSGTLTFNPGDQTQTITLTILGNDFVEQDEAFALRLFNAQGAGFGDSPTDVVSITIPEDFNVQNEPPVARNDSFTDTEDTTVSGNVLTNNGQGADSDPDQNPLTVSLDDMPDNGSVVLNSNGTFTYTPNANFNGTDTFRYILDDGRGGTDTGVVTITVAPVNDEPVLKNDSFFIDEDTSITANVTANNGGGADADPENDPFTVSVVNGPQNGSLTLNPNGTFTYTPDADFNGEDSFTYRAVDPSGAVADPATVTILVEEVQDIPTAQDDSFIGVEGSVLLGNVLADNGNGEDFDIDGDAITAVAISQPQNGTVSILSGGAFLFIPNEGFFGTDFFVYRVTDSAGNSDIATATVEIQARTMLFGIDVDETTIDEGNGGITTLTFDVTRNGNTDDIGQVDYSLVGTGVNPLTEDDIEGEFLSGTITFGAGQTSVTVSVDIIADLAPEEDETLALSLTNAVNQGQGTAQINTASTTVTVSNDDTATEVGTSGRDKLRGDDDDDVIFADDGDDRVRGDDGDDVLIGAGGDDRLDGNDDDDVLEGGDGDDRLRGGNDDDTLNGGDGDDRLDGGRGDDVLRGGGGSDRLKGGRDSDTFVFRPGDGVVQVDDFREDDDLLDLRGFGPQFDTLEELLFVADQDGRDVEFNLNGDRLILRKVDLEDLEDADLFIL